MRKYKCGDYLRLSKEDLLKKDESTSIESQRMIIESFCKYHNLELVSEYVDDGFSGGNFERPGFKKMIEDIESGKIDCILTKDFSRLGRELYQTGSFIEEYFNEKGIRYISINDGYDSLNGDSTISMKLTFNDFTLRDTSKKVKSAFTVRQKKGEYIGSIPKYGFLKDPTNHHNLIIDPIASLIVKRIFNMAYAGNSCYKIAAILTSEKVPIPIVYKHETRGALVTENDGYGIWRPQTIKSILTSEMYIGNMVQNTYNKIRYNSKKIRAVKKEDYIIVENTHEAIIDKEIFYKVNKMLKANSKTVEKNKERYLFSGLLKCKECGHNISILERKNKGNKSHYTQCNQYSKKGKYGICNIHRLNYNLLEEDLVSVITSISKSFLNEYDNKSLTNEANEILHEETNELQKQIDVFIKEIAKYNNAIEQLYMDKVQGKIPENIFTNLLEKYNEDLNNATTRKNELEQDKIKMLAKIESLDYDTCAEKIKKFLSSKHPTRAMIVELVDRVEIDNNKNINVFFRFQELSSYVR
mgnify:FL=1